MEETDIQEFLLKVNEEDILDIYKEDFNYKLFSDDNNPKLAFSALFLLLSFLSIFGSKYSHDYFFFTLLFLAGTGYYLILILSDYWNRKKKQKDIKTWVDNLKKYKFHKLTVHTDFFKYIRDEEVYTYNINQAETLLNTDEYFYCKLKSDHDIMLLAKAFKDNQYQEFIALINKMKQ
jgi:hypothetical protein